MPSASAANHRQEAIAALLVGLVWGSTNPFIRRGSLVAESLRARQGGQGKWSYWLTPRLVGPWLLNQCGSVLFVLLLGQADVSTAVPVANAVSIAANAVVDLLLGERYKLHLLLPGCLLVAAGVLLCTL